jgi:glucose/arabinose dehydrogenase
MNIHFPFYQYCLSIVLALGLSHNAYAEPDLSKLKLPDGFKIKVFADKGLENPRFMAFDNEGNLYVSDPKADQVYMLPDRDHNGVSDEVVTIAKDLNSPQGLVLTGSKLYIANQDGVVVLSQENGHWAGKPKALISGLATGGHTLKSLKLGPDNHLYINVGSSCNVCNESDPSRATMLRYTLAGKPAGDLVTVGRHQQSAIWARGLRNSQGYAWHPETKAMYATNNGSDMRSSTKSGPVNDELPPEHLNVLEGGKHYGWPHCWGNAADKKGQLEDPKFPGEAGFCKTTQPPAITFTSHSTPIGISFLDKAAFPDNYQDDAIVALHGSWNRQQPSGYKLVQVKFQEGKPSEVVDFATGWLEGDQAWGRPVDVAVGTDKALYVSDDKAGVIYRITYEGK